MLVSRDKLFLVFFLIIFSLTPCLGQMGGLADAAAGPQFPGMPPQASTDMKLANSGLISGTVCTMANKPVANARVEISSLTRGDQSGPQFTARNGSFTITNLAPGDYEIRAVSGLQEASQRVQVVNGENWVTLRLPPASSAQGGDGNASAVSVQQLRVPNKAVSLLGKARHAISKKRLGQAVQFIAKALAVYPQYAEALALRGVLELQGKQFVQAAADANQAIQADPNYGIGYLVMGAALNRQEKYQDALRPLERAEVLEPGAWQVYFESTKALLQLGKYQDALRQANRALGLADGVNHAELHFVKAYACIGLHTYGAAQSELQQYLKQDPDGPYAAAARASLTKIRPLAAAAVAP